MEQKDLWNSKWNKINKKVSATNFAKKTYKTIQKKNFKSLLDLGCGDGKDSIYFAKKGFKVISVDFSKVAISKLHEKIEKENVKNISSRVEDIKEINFKENSFDIIYANLSLHYFNDKETIEIFNKLLKILNKNGYIFVRCKSTRDSLYKNGTQIEKDFYTYKGKIYHLFSKEYLQSLMNNFEIIKLRNFSSKHLTMEEGIIKSFFVECIAKK